MAPTFCLLALESTLIFREKSQPPPGRMEMPLVLLSGWVHRGPVPGHAHAVRADREPQLGVRGPDI